MRQRQINGDTTINNPDRPQNVAVPPGPRPTLRERIRLWRSRDRYYDRRTGAAYTVDEHGDRVYDRRSGAAGIAAVLGAAALIVGAYTLHEVEEIEHRQAEPATIKHIEDNTIRIEEKTDAIKNKIRLNGRVVVLPNGLYKSSRKLEPGTHLDYHDDSTDHRLTGVLLPRNLHLRKSSDGLDILKRDNKSSPIVGVLKSRLFDSQGKLSWKAKHILKINGFKVTWGRLGDYLNRKMTIVQNR
jgi:hypothetical protein